MSTKADDNNLGELVDDCVVCISEYIEAWEIPVFQTVNKRIFRTLKKYRKIPPRTRDMSLRPFGDILLRDEFDTNWSHVRGFKWDRYKNIMADCGFALYMTNIICRGKSFSERERLADAYQRHIHGVYLQLEMLDITKAEFRGMIGYAEFLHERGIVMQCGNDHTVVYYTFPLPEDVHEVIDITADDSD